MGAELASQIKGQKIGFATGPKGYDSNRPTIVLIPGAGGSRLSWRNQLEPLDKALNVIVLELPGHGETSGDAAADVAIYTNFVIRVIEAWGLNKPILAGHSLGGAIALETALRRSDLLSGIILISTGAHLPVNAMLFEGLEKDCDATIGVMMKWCFTKSADPALLAEAGRVMAQTPPETLAGDFRACDLFDCRDDIHNIDLPALVVCGAQDKMTPPAMSEFLCEKIPGARLELVDNAGHIIQEERPDELNKRILDFTKAVSESG
jgi:pimeloyl-ACP methyl ester carboxylesterase